MTLAQIEARLKEVTNKQRTLLNVYKEKGSLNTEQSTEYKSLKTEAKDLENKRNTLHEEADFYEGELKALNNVAPSSTPSTNPVGGASLPRVTKDRADNLLEDPAKGFSTPLEYMRALTNAYDNRSKYAKGNKYGGPDERLKLLNAVGSDEQSTIEDPYGGFFVPTAFSPGIREMTAPADQLAPLVTRVPMTAPKVEIPARVDKTHTNSVTGGLQWYRRKELGSATSSRMEFEMVGMSANTLTGLAYCSEELMTDSPVSFSGILARGFQDGLGDKLMRERITGTGVGEMQGIKDAKTVPISVAKETSQVADTIVGMNVLKMRKQIYNYGSSVWLINNDCYVQISQLHIESANNAGLIKMFHPSLTTDAPDMLLGRPIIWTDYTETLGDKGDIILFNPTEYLEGVYEGLTSGESIHVRFVEHERAFRFGYRNDGRLWWKAQFTPPKSSVKRSPVILLAERA